VTPTTLTIAAATTAAISAAATATVALIIAARLRHRLAVALSDVRHDQLTGLLNRAGIAAVHHDRYRDQPVIAVLTDLDNFKTINDSYGHDIGDTVLTVVAGRLADAAAPFGGAVGRLSGDEFLILLPDTGLDPAAPVNTVVARASAPISIQVEDGVAVVDVGVSGGAALGRPGEPLPGLLRRADLALYHAKHAGTPVVFHRADMVMPPLSGRTARLRDRRGDRPQP
jgi:diguanylate cyclase (GGDEF)-like protein